MTTALFNYRKPGYRQFVESEAFKAQANGNQYQIKINSIFKKYASQLKGLIGKSGNPYEGEDDGSYPERMKQIFAAVEQIPEAMKDFDQIAKEREQLFAKTVYQAEKKVKSARGMKTSLSKEGFLCYNHISSVQDWENDSEIVAKYYREVENIAKEVTGATHTFCNSHLYRRSNNAETPLGKIFGASISPVKSVHNDFTEYYGPALLKTFAGDESTTSFGVIDQMKEAGVTLEYLSNCQIIVLNTWRPIIENPLLRNPLALIDNRTVTEKELIPVTLGDEKTGLEVCISEYNPAHEFYYYPNQTKNELLVFKTYDSERIPFIPTLHTSFDDPNTPADAEERKSVEVRVICLVEKGQNMSKL